MSEISRSSRRTSCWITSSSPRANFGPGDGQGFDGAAQGGERVLQFVRDIGGEALGRLHAAEQRAGHVAQGAGQMADLVVAVGEVGNFLPLFDAAPDAVGGFGQLAHGLGDGSRQRGGQQEHHGRGDEEDAEDRPPLRGDARRCPALRRKQQRAAHRAEALDRRGDGNHRLAARIGPHEGFRLAIQRLATSG